MARPIPPERLQDLVEAATAVFLEQGYRRTQMADVAERLGVAKGTLYLYVESKEALLDLALRCADAREPLALPDELPVPTPTRGAMLAHVEKRITAESAWPALRAALSRARVTDVRAELVGIARELYALLARHRTAIRLLDRCAADYPELAEVWFRAGRRGALDLLSRYLEDRARRRRLRPGIDLEVAARFALETLTFWAVHRHFDLAPQRFDESAAAESVVDLVVAALVEEP